MQTDQRAKHGPIVVRPRKQYLYRFFKRFFDTILSALGLICLSPLFLVLAIWIMIDDFGSPFYSQVRIGKNGRRFRMWKLRSMVKNADALKKELMAQNEIEGAMFKMKDDPRITRVGHFIRKYSLDELPQLFNVLKGDMSLVGPRPPLPEEVAQYTDYQKQRLLVTPGCTGLWQVTVRNEADFDEMVDIDLNYIQQRGFMMDLWILVMTVKVMIKPNGAY